MNWNYTGRPDSNDRDKVRFLVGDTCEKQPLVADEEVDYSISDQPNLILAAAMVLRALAAKFSRLVSSKVGDVSVSSADKVAEGYTKRANELDPNGLTMGAASLVLPSFGGLTISGKEKLDEDTDAVQPSFKKGMNDIPGGPGDVAGGDEPWIRWPL